MLEEITSVSFSFVAYFFWLKNPQVIRKRLIVIVTLADATNHKMYSLLSKACFFCFSFFGSRWYDTQIIEYKIYFWQANIACLCASLIGVLDT